MPADIQTHHALPNAVYNRFKTDIAKWTGFDYSQNAGYNLIQLPKGTNGAAVQADSPAHNGTHPGQNTAWTDVLDDINHKVDNGQNTRSEAGNLFTQADTRISAVGWTFRTRRRKIRSFSSTLTLRLLLRSLSSHSRATGTLGQ